MRILQFLLYVAGREGANDLSEVIFIAELGRFSFGKNCLFLNSKAGFHEDNSVNFRNYFLW